MLPTNHISYRDETYRGSLSVGARSFTTLFNKTFPVDVFYSLTAGRNLHKFRRNNVRGANTEYYISHSLSLSKNISNFSLGLSGSLNPIWTYTNVYEPTFSLSQYVSYTTKQGMIVTLSHATSDRALDYRGDFSNVKLLDDYNSTINLSLAYIIR